MPTKRAFFMLLVAFGFISAPVQQGHARDATRTAENLEAAMQTNDNKLIAIDVLIEPDRTMVDKSNAVNARLRANYPAGYPLDATHAPHVTLLQRFVRASDLDAVTVALTKLFATERPTDLRLKAKGYEYTIWAGVAVTV